MQQHERNSFKTVEHFSPHQNVFHEKYFDNGRNFDKTYFDFKWDDMYMYIEKCIRHKQAYR